MKSFEKVLSEVEKFITNLNLKIYYTENLNKFFKGDLDGKNIWINKHLSAEEKLFNLLHLAGHCIQWNTNTLYRVIGSRIYKKPSALLLSELMEYEYEAALYSAKILEITENWKFISWLNIQCKNDMLYLYNFYTSGKKLKNISKRIYKYITIKEGKDLPKFIPKPSPNKRNNNGIVMDFST